MSGFQDPVCILGVSDHVVVPFDDEVAGCAFESGGTRKTVDIQLRFGRHGEGGEGGEGENGENGKNGVDRSLSCLVTLVGTPYCWWNILEVHLSLLRYLYCVPVYGPYQKYGVWSMEHGA
jgi:hypothetical protein